jgi:hypothetical protein
MCQRSQQSLTYGDSREGRTPSEPTPIHDFEALTVRFSTLLSVDFGLAVRSSSTANRQSLDDVAARRAELGGRPYRVAAHGNRLIAFLDIYKQKPQDPNAPVDEYTSSSFVAPRVSKAHSVLRDALEKEYSGSVYRCFSRMRVNASQLFEMCRRKVDKNPVLRPRSCASTNAKESTTISCRSPGIRRPLDI